MDSERAQDAGRRERLTRLIRMYEKDLLRMCCIQLKDMALAEDAVQETFIKAYRALDTFRGESSERTWLMRIAINVCRDMQRGFWNRHRSAAVDWERLKVPVEHEMDTSLALTEAILKLPAAQREAVYLHFYEDLNINEVADLLGCSSSTASRTIDRAIKRLRKELDAVQRGGVIHA